jgi:sialate O-acetylesterase
MNTYQTIKNTGIAVALELGEFNEIHPKDKAPVGERLALQALYNVYNKIDKQKAFGPIYNSFEYKDGGIELSFDNADEGFKIKGDLTGFEMAGDDRQYFKADAVIRGSRIFISSDKVDTPKFARYCWTNYGEVSVYGRNNLPLAPFRTSSKEQ